MAAQPQLDSRAATRPGSRTLLAAETAALTAHRDHSAPRISVIIVSDYEAAGSKTWADEHAAVDAFLTEQDELGEPIEIIVMEALPPSGHAPQVPPALAQLAPRVSVYFEPSTRSSTLKDAALKYCHGELIAVVEADCVTQRGWLKQLVAALDADAKLHVVSGRTIYGKDSAMKRVATLLDRGFMEQCYAGRYIHVSNNGAMYRRQVLERYPYPDDVNPFVSAELRHNLMHGGGVRMGVEIGAVMRHGYGGVRFLADVRRNKGFQAARIISRKRGRSERGSGFMLSLRAVSRGIRDDFATVRAVGSRFLRWYDWPLLALVFIAMRFPEFAGAMAVHDPDRFAETTAYR